MATISNTPRPGYVWDSTDNVWYPIGVGNHNHNEIAKTIVDAKGDLIAATAADTVDRLAVGADGSTLVADSATATGLKWATPASGGMTLLSTTTLSGLTTSITSISQDYKNLQIIVSGANAASAFNLEINVEVGFNTGNLIRGRNDTNLISTSKNYFGNYNSISTGGNNVFVMHIYDYTSARYKMGYQHSIYTNSTSDQSVIVQGGWTGATVIDAVTITSDVSLTAGTCLIYGVK